VRSISSLFSIAPEADKISFVHKAHNGRVPSAILAATDAIRCSSRLCCL
jgi:hypothetical protein